MDSFEAVDQQLTAAQLKARAEITRHTADQMMRPGMRRRLLQIAEECGWHAARLEASAWAGDCEPSLAKENSHPETRPQLRLTEAERQWLIVQRGRSWKHGHLRHDARVYRNPNGSLWLDCAQCVRKSGERLSPTDGQPDCPSTLIGTAPGVRLPTSNSVSRAVDPDQDFGWFALVAAEIFVCLWTLLLCAMCCLAPLWCLAFAERWCSFLDAAWLAVGRTATVSRAALTRTGAGAEILGEPDIIGAPASIVGGGALMANGAGFC